MTGVPASLHRLWLVHLGLLLAAAVSLGLPFIQIDYRSPNIDYDVSWSFLGGGSSSAGGDSGAPAGFPSYQEALDALDPVESPMDLAPLVQVGFVIASLSVMRRREGAVLGIIGGAMGLLSALAIRLMIASEASAAGEILGERLHVVLGAGTVFVPLAFAGLLAWNVIRVTAGSREAAAPPPVDVPEHGAPPPPRVLRAVGWYLVVLGALAVISATGSDVPEPGSQAGWQAVTGAVTMAAGFGLIAAKRWGFAIAVVLGALNGILVVIVLFVSSTSQGTGRIIIPFAFLTALYVTPFALLLRRDCRAWFSKSDRIHERAGPRV